MRNKTQKAMRAGGKDYLTRKALESLVEELLACDSKRAARAFNRYLVTRIDDGWETTPNSLLSKRFDPVHVLAEELLRRKKMTGKEVLQFWVLVNKGNTAKRLLDSVEKAEEAAEKRDGATAVQS